VVVKAFAGAMGAVAVLVSPIACASLIGIDDPHVVQTGGAGDAAGGEDSTAPGSDANAGDGASEGADAVPQPPPSCLSTVPGLTAGLTDCGPHGSESCCASPLVERGTFYRSYDDVTFTSNADPATVSSFRLDRFEVTVGRFREFVDRVVAGWIPPAGSGTHAYLNNGSGLNGTEQGWDAAWDANLATTSAAWDTNLVTSCPTSPTWMGSPGLPINCITWYEAYAFCIWDGGFLPSEAEWNYAAAGGDYQRVYAWSMPSTSTSIDCSKANYANLPTCGSSPRKGGSAPAGDGRWGQADLTGNVREWVLDSYQVGYPDPCTDCAVILPNSLVVNRGGGFADPPMFVLASYRPYDSPTYRDSGIGVRCARAPSGP
jgi:formylglycine-generating enzyme required for sulfatase activity